MSLFNQQKKDWEYELIQEGEENILYIYAEGYPTIPSIEDNPLFMAKTIDIINQVGGVTKIVFMQKRDYEYDFEQTKLLFELASIYKSLVKDPALLRYGTVGLQPTEIRKFNQLYAKLQNMLYQKLKEDPIGTYVELKRETRAQRMYLQRAISRAEIAVINRYIMTLQHILTMLEKTQLLQLVAPQLPGHMIGNREIYRNIFTPTIKPDFMFTKLMADYPVDGEEVDSYTLDEDTEVTVFKFSNSIETLYHIIPPEFKLTEEKYELLDMARKVLSEHKPTEEEFTDPQKMRQVFFNIGRDLLEELSTMKGIQLRQKELEKITNILVRYTVGFGIIEVLLKDEKIQDISINSPMGKQRIFIVHGDYNECTTNIIPTKMEAESWATKLRMVSGRPLDEADPILDTELELPGASTRVSVITKPLDPTGLAFSFRRHRDKPWTLPLFIKYKMLNPIAAGLLSFLVDGSRAILIAGTRSSGKSSFLTALMVEIMRKYRVITIEDTLEIPVAAFREQGFNIQQLKVASALARGSTEMSASAGIRSTLRLGDSALIIGEVRSSLRGNEEVVVIEKGLTKRVPIQNLENKSLHSFLVPTLDEEQKMKLQKLTGFVKHPMRSQLLKITTKSGREVTVTPDHSVFTHVNFKITAINSDQLNVNDPIIIPAKIPCGFNDINHLNLLEVFKNDYRVEGAEPYIRKAIAKVGWRKATKICGISDIYMYLRSKGELSRIPISHFLKLMNDAQIEYNIEDLRIKRGTSLSIPAKFPINENILRLIGYYLAEGNLDGKKIQITNSKPKIIEDIEKICRKEFGFKIYKRLVVGLGTSIQMFITCKPLTDLFECWGCGRTSLHKRIPGFVFGLTEKKICALLQGMYSGDGSFSSTKKAGNMIRYFSTSKGLVEDVGYALLSTGIVCRFHDRNLESGKKFYTAEIKQRKYIELFLLKIGFTHKKPELLIKSFPHSKDDSVFFDPKELERHLKLPRKYRHLRKTKCCSKDYLKRITEEVKCSDEIYNFTHGDFFIDKLKSVEIINLNKPEHVYDLNVKSTERFIGGFGGILLHNTEAIALYEAMRVGAAANVVAGTIHADSPYGVYDRVVNDIGVPKTSFKATDVIIVANPVRSADGLKKQRRIIQVTEVRKTWEDDPLKEKGFGDLLKYSPERDELEVTDIVKNGESEVLKAIAGSIKEFAGNWDAVWENIVLRAKIKEELVKAAEEFGNSEILEAGFVIEANDRFHLACEEVKEEMGTLNSEEIFHRWQQWLQREIRRFREGIKPDLGEKDEVDKIK